ncbi:hypothetical protein [Pseudomonas sp. I2]|uniref:hypothetical protein n=1 Tax=Pseudomonas sp. I2 TaxID=1338438 RepID=UPI0034D3E427
MELETYANHMKSSAASYIGMPFLIYIITIAWGAAITGPDKINIGTIFRNWYASLRRQLHKPYGWLWAPITIPAWIIWLLINAYPDSVEAWLQYNVPYATFPAEIDVLCGFAEKRKPVIRGNGERIEP